MSPPLFLLGSVSILAVWLITTLGWPADLWTFGLIPVLSVYLLCDVPKLQEAAAARVRGPWAQTLSAAIAILFYILRTRFVAIHFILWKLGVLLVWLFCMIKAFDFEKMMYMTDTYGAVAKSIAWNAITSFTGQARWMTYKGEWAYCCPYTRKLVNQEIDHYYTLQIKDEEHDYLIPESYAFNFHIGSCDVVCAYTRAAEDSVDASADYTHASTLVSSPEESQVSSMPSLVLQEKERADALSTTSCPEGESLSPKTQPVMEDHYTLVPSLVNKLEVSLKYGNEALESYTYYDRPSEAVAELKRALNVLQNEGNLIFSNLNRHSGSSRPQAHARCHEFGELLNLILIHKHKLHHVDLQAKYRCIISGHWTLKILMIPILVWINYYQIVQKAANHTTVIFLLSMFASIGLLGILGEYVSGPHHTIRACVYFIIDWIAPNKKEDLYRFFQVYAAWLTYSNESYGYPCCGMMREVCFLGGSNTRLPVTGGIETPKRFQMDDLKAGVRVFDMKNLQLELIVTQFTQDPPVEGGYRIPVENDWHVDVQMRRTYNNSYCYRRMFPTDRSKAMNLLALMKWIEDNKCMGVCKDWPKRSLMYPYTYEELFEEVLLKGAKPMILTFISPLDVRVE